jgi:hypothetical protein
VFCFLLLSGTYQKALAQTAWSVVNTFPIGGQGAWDYLTPDPQTHRLYVPRTTHTMVIDSESGKVIADIPGQQAAHGVALAPAAGRGWTYQHRPNVQGRVLRRQKSLALSDEAKRIAWKAQQRLHKRFTALAARGKNNNVIVTALARELLGFMWAIAVHTEAQSKPAKAA